MRRQHHLVLSFVVMLSAVACKSESKTPSPPEPTSAEAPRARTVAVLVDGTAATGLAVAAAMPRRTLRESVADHTPPHDQWERVVAVGNGRRLEIAMADYRGYDLVFYEDGKARPALGLFRKTSTAEDAPLQAVVDLERIEILTVGAAKAPAREATLEVVRGGATKIISQAQLATLKAVPWRADGRKQQEMAWGLREVLAIAGPLEAGVSVTIRNAEGAASVQQLEGGDAEKLLIKDNRRGSFHLKRLDAIGKTVWRFKNATSISIE